MFMHIILSSFGHLMSTKSLKSFYKISNGSVSFRIRITYLTNQPLSSSSIFKTDTGVIQWSMFNYKRCLCRQRHQLGFVNAWHSPAARWTVIPNNLFWLHSLRTSNQLHKCIFTNVYLLRNSTDFSNWFLIYEWYQINCHSYFRSRAMHGIFYA